MSAQILLLNDGDLGVRIAAVMMLNSFGISAKPSIPRLCEMLFDEEDSVLLDSVCGALIKIGADADSLLSRMMERLRSLDQGLRVEAAELLARFYDHAATKTTRASRERLLPGLLKLCERRLRSRAFAVPSFGFSGSTSSSPRRLRLNWQTSWRMTIKESGRQLCKRLSSTGQPPWHAP